MNPLSPRTQRLLELARDDEPPHTDVQDRVERSLARRVALGAGVVATGAAVTKSAVGAGVAMTIVKPLAIAGLVAGVAVASWQAADWVVPENTAPRPATKPAQPAKPQGPAAAPLAAPPPALDPASAPPAQVAAANTTRGRGAAPPTGVFHELGAPAVPAPPPAPVVADGLRAETDALKLAQRALRDGDAARALTLLDEQDQSYGAGLLQQERAAARVMALCQVGQAARARTEAENFERRFPRSPLVARVRSSCREP